MKFAARALCLFASITSVAIAQTPAKTEDPLGAVSKGDGSGACAGARAPD